MKDLIIKETGNSRTLKSSLDELTPWETALEMLRAGTFPIDLLGLQDDGVEQKGTPVTKETMLTDETAALLELGGDPTVNQALASLAGGIKVAGTKYGTCSTPTGTAAKVAEIAGFTLSTGAVVAVKFSAINTAAQPTLNVNSTGAHPIFDYRSNTYPTPGSLLNSTHLFVYNGTQWVLLNPASSFDLLGSLDWTALGTLSAAGALSSMCAVGDCKAVKLNGTVGCLTFTDTTIYAFILGFNHNSGVEGDNLTHWQIGKTAANGGADVALCDNKYNTSSADPCFHMNTTADNKGGWNGSYAKKTLMPAMKNAFPSDLKSAIKKVNKWTDNTGGGQDTSSYVTSTQEEVFLLAEYEYFGARSYANTEEQKHQKQYDYYANGNSKIKYRHDQLSTACIVWLRSPFASDAGSFCNVYTYGTAGNSGANGSFGFAPGFCI